MKRYIQVFVLAAIFGSCSEPKIQLRAPVPELSVQSALKDSLKVDTVKVNAAKKN